MNLPVRSLAETPAEEKRKMRSDDFRLKMVKKDPIGRRLGWIGPQRWQLFVWAGHTEVAGERNPAVLLPSSSVIDFKSRLGETLRTKHPLVGGLSFHGVSGMCLNSLVHRLPGGIQAQGMRHPTDAGLGLLLWGSDNCL